MEKIIAKFCEENGVIYGICDARKLEYPGERDICDIPFFHRSAADRLDPKLLLKFAESIIVIGACYGKKLKFENDGLTAQFTLPVNQKIALRGRFALNAVGTDYHITLKNLLSGLREEMSRFSEFASYIHVDTGPLYERGFAVKANLGAYTPNGNILSEKFGSFFNIGLMLVSLKLEPTKKSPHDFCKGCKTLCVSACPTGALTDNGFEYRKCISYLTQKKGELTEKESLSLGNHLYGCDICQSVCPHNSLNNFEGEINYIDDIFPKLDVFDNLNEEEFSEKFGDRAFHWRGLKVLRRNAGYARQNYKNAE